MQVLILGSLIAVIVVLMLRFSVTRTTNIVKTQRTLISKAYAEGCLAQFMTSAMDMELRGELPPFVGPFVPLHDFGAAAMQNTFNCSMNIGGAQPRVSSFTFVDAERLFIPAPTGIPGLPTTTRLNLVPSVLRMSMEVDLTRPN